MKVLVNVYDRERKICDLIKYRDRYDAETFLNGVKIYAKSHLNQIRLFQYAKEMKIENKVYEIMKLITY